MKSGKLILISAFVILLAPALFAAKPSWTWLDAPVIDDLCIAAEEGLFTPEWYAVSGANKYSVDLELGYDTDDDGCADTYFEYTFSSDGDATSIEELDLADYPYCLEFDTEPPYDCIDEIYPITASWKVKALNPPKKKYGDAPENNPWSDWCEVLNLEECLPEF